MRIVLANAPWYRPGHYGVRAGSRWPHFERNDSPYMPFPFFMAYAAALLERAGHQVTVVDGVAERLTVEQFDDRVLAAASGLLLLEISTASLDSDIADLRRLRARLPGTVRLAVAGVHAPMHEPAFLREHSEIDFALIGEYEETLRELAAALVGGNEAGGDISGLVWRGRDGTVTANRRRELRADIDGLPWPARHLFPMARYWDVPGGMPLPSVQLWGSRGCPYGCVYCAWPQIIYGSRRYRPRSAYALADEFAHLVTREGYRSVYFDDDTFNIGRERLLAFSAELVRRGLHTPWAIMARADLMDRELLVVMRDAGLAAVKYGVESADQGIIDRSGKDLDLDVAIANIRLTMALGIKTHLTFCFGLPGETRATALRTIALALDLAPDSVQFSLATPFPGSRYFHEAESAGTLVTRDYAKYDGYTTAVVRTESLGTEELEGLRALAERRWSARQLCRRILRRPVHYLADWLRHPATLMAKLARLRG